MSFEPRMRGRRFGRPAAKKSSARDRRETSQSAIFYEEATPIDPNAIKLNVLNSIAHLGNQRFVLPPFSEHFQRWISDVKAVITEFEAQLPQVVGPQYREQMAKAMSNLETGLAERITAETKLSGQRTELQRQVSAIDHELSRLEHEHKMSTTQLRKRNESSLQRLRGEIDTLDKERLRILHTKPTLFQRLLRKPDSILAEKRGALESKKKNLKGEKEALNQLLEKNRATYEDKRRELNENVAGLRAEMGKIQGETVDDALEFRKTACEELSRILKDAVDTLPKDQNAENVEENQQAV